jgi:3',5'-cyclic AMP phosphodiesterase CpdA
MYRIAHLSDLHFGSEIPAVVAALTETLNADPPDLVAISGDLTLRALGREFRKARAFIEELRAPVFFVPGNHDITRYRILERFLDPFHRWHRHMGTETEPVYQDRVVGVVGLNTARRAGFSLDWSRGRVGSNRLTRCEARLATLPPGLVRIVVAHHPFLPPSSAPQAQLVGGAPAALRMFARQSVRLVLSGHLHLAGVTEHPAAPPTRAAPASQGPSGPLTVVLSATTTSHRLRGEPNAFNEIRIDDDRGVQIATRAWDGARFAPVPPAVVAVDPAEPAPFEAEADQPAG